MLNKPMKRILTRILEISSIVGVLLVVTLLFNTYKGRQNYNVVDAKAMEKIIPELDATVGENAFYNPRLFMSALVSKMVDDKLMIPTPFGLTWSADVFKKEYTLLIDSKGGRVDILFQLLSEFEEFQKRGISFKCYIANSQSAAFTFMVSVCSKGILLRGGTVMQHFAYTRLNGVSNTAYMLSRKMAMIESKALLVPFKEWFDLTRLENDDKIFTVEELKKYGIIQKVYGE